MFSRPSGRFAISVGCFIAIIASARVWIQAQTPGQAGARAVPSVGGSAPIVTRESDGRVTIIATRISRPVKIDGRLDDEIYGEVPSFSELVQQEPDGGKPISERTEMWLMFDDKNIYVACRCWDQHPERIVANDMRRDGSRQTQHDNFAVTFDTFHDRRNAFLFGVTADGGLRDGQITDERPNMNWNAIFESQAARFENGWTAEIAVPFRSLRYAPGPKQQVWGIQLRRYIASKNERAHLTQLSPVSGTGGINYMSQAATMLGLEVPPTAINLEVKPYAISGLTTDTLAKPPVHNHVSPDAGLDVKYGVTKSLTADFTYNTDFAQVEADDAQVNLTRFSLSLPEKREFFLEGGGLFAFGTAPGGVSDSTSDAPTIFYSRRIGLNGAREVPVMGGGRLSGKTGPWSIGALNLETDNEASANAVRTNFTVFRPRLDILRRSTIGGLYTHRSVSTVSPGGNDVWGLDTNLAFYDNVYLAAYVSQSLTEKARHDNFSYRTQFNYASDRYGLSIDRLVVDPAFNPEVGFVRRQNFRRSAIAPRFSPRTKNNKLVRRWTYQGNFEYVTTDRNALESRELSGLFRTEFHSSDTITIQHLRLLEALTVPFEISPGVRIPVGAHRFNNTVLTYVAGQNHRVSGTTSVEVGSFYDGDKRTLSYNGRVEVTPELSVEPNISLNWIDLPEGNFTNSIASGRVTYTMSPQMFVAGLVQYGSSNSALLANLRFRWEYRPGSELFLVYTEGRSTLPVHGTDLQSRGFVVKINRLLRF